MYKYLNNAVARNQVHSNVLWQTEQGEVSGVGYKLYNEVQLSQVVA